MDTSETLTKAADVMVELGHAKGLLQDSETGGVCLRGAVQMVLMGNALYWIEDHAPAFEAIVAEARAERIAIPLSPWHDEGDDGLDIGGVIRWNNAPSTTADDVISLLRKAAARVAATEGKTP